MIDLKDWLFLFISQVTTAPRVKLYVTPTPTSVSRATTVWKVPVYRVCAPVVSTRTWTTRATVSLVLPDSTVTTQSDPSLLHPPTSVLKVICLIQLWNFLYSMTSSYSISSDTEIPNFWGFPQFILILLWLASYCFINIRKLIKIEPFFTLKSRKSWEVFRASWYHWMTSSYNILLMVIINGKFIY